MSDLQQSVPHPDTLIFIRQKIAMANIKDKGIFVSFSVNTKSAAAYVFQQNVYFQVNDLSDRGFFELLLKNDMSKSIIKDRFK